MSKKVNALLVELMIVVLFFSLACIILIKVYAGAASVSIRAGDRNSALLEAQNLAEQIYCADDVKALLEENILNDDNFEEIDPFILCGDNVWEKDAVDNDNIRFRYTAISEPAEGESGLREGKLEAFSKNDMLTPLFTLDCSRYLPGKAVGQ